MLEAPIAALRSAGDRARWLPPSRDLLTAAVFASLVVLTTGGGSDPVQDLGLALMTVPLAWRRRVPTAAFLAQLTGIAVTGGMVPTAAFFAVLIGVYSLSTYARSTRWSLALLLATATWVAVQFGDATPSMPPWLTPFALVVPLWLMGLQVRRWRRAADASAAHAQTLKHAGELATQQAVAQEKARIAREMHDIVTHNVSVMVIQAAAAQQAMTSEPGFALAAMAAVEKVGQEAMTDLRQIFDVLREADDDVAADLRPQATVEQLENLLTRVRSAGLDVTATWSGSRRPVPTGLSLAAYRIVQEALTNVLRHARGSTAEVLLDYGDTGLFIVVTNTVAPQPAEPSTSPGGRGLIGLTERVHALGGEFSAAARITGGYQVRALLPWNPS